jgi:hypothetical protein
MHQGRPLTQYALDFLRQQDLPGLFPLACGEITHEAYVAALDADYLARKPGREGSASSQGSGGAGT